MSKKKQKKQKGLSDQIEIIREPASSDTVYGNPEEFVVPLLREIAPDLDLPSVDISTPESARAASTALSQHLKQIHSHRDRVQKLKSVLEKKKFEL